MCEFEKLYLDLIAAISIAAKDPSITSSALAYILICLNPIIATFCTIMELKVVDGGGEADTPLGNKRKLAGADAESPAGNPICAMPIDTGMMLQQFWPLL